MIDSDDNVLSFKRDIWQCVRRGTQKRLAKMGIWFFLYIAREQTARTHSVNEKKVCMCVCLWEKESKGKKERKSGCEFIAFFTHTYHCYTVVDMHPIIKSPLRGRRAYVSNTPHFFHCCSIGTRVFWWGVGFSVARCIRISSYKFNVFQNAVFAIADNNETIDCTNANGLDHTWKCISLIFCVQQYIIHYLLMNKYNIFHWR